MKKLLIATTNPGKVSEYMAIFDEMGLAVEAISLKDAGITQKMEETGNTFEENAIQKAKFYYKLSGLATLSDDAGLGVDYLNGEPGVKSRRWPGYEASDEELQCMALDKLNGVPAEKRGAQLRAVIALMFPGEEIAYTFEGVLRGHITQKPFDKIVAGYPFRSIFVTAGNQFGHRKQAMEKALPLLKKNFKF